IQYVGSPFPPDVGNPGPADDDPPGVEIPFIGFDWNVLTITTGDLDQIHVGFDPTPVLFNEANAPDPATAQLHISPSTHPEFTIKWDAVPVNGDPVGPGEATPN